jgi:hypothetical protein
MPTDQRPEFMDKSPSFVAAVLLTIALIPAFI